MHSWRCIMLGTGLLAATTASAHHGFGNFAMNEDIALSGVITRLDFVNPHAWLHFDVSNSDGTLTAHRCELRSATTLRRSGWTPDMFPAGMQITIQGSPDRSEPNACYISTLTFSDGSSLDRYGQRIEATAGVARAARLPGGEPNIAGDWAQEQRVMTDPRGRDGTLVPLSQAAAFGTGGVPEGQSEIPGARGTAAAAAPIAAASLPAANAVVALNDAGRVAMQALVDIPRAVRSCTTFTPPASTTGVSGSTSHAPCVRARLAASFPTGVVGRSIALARAPTSSRCSMGFWGSNGPFTWIRENIPLYSRRVAPATRSGAGTMTC